MKTLMLLVLTFGWSSGELSKPVPHKKRELPPDTSERVMSTHTFDTKSSDSNHYGHKFYREVTITKNVPVPYPVKIERHVAVPVQVPYPITVQKRVPIMVERKIPIYVDKPIPVQVDRPVPYPLPIEVPVFHKVAVEVPKPYPVHIPSPYPVYIQQPLYVKHSRPNRIKKHTIRMVRSMH
ncbi:zinc finger protein 512B-like isoform X1 [Wyeomyia smithii]|uniref:zinc finger protein 512B-like isoform X1 n=2 Tax=Wyeomyia smithii TaxID=174621 RepID=UPI002467BC47|nr:zinc finger protein 512B-like isoform X1 [Wyeomyia smithii]